MTDNLAITVVGAESYAFNSKAMESIGAQLASVYESPAWKASALFYSRLETQAAILEGLGTKLGLSKYAEVASALQEHFGANGLTTQLEAFYAQPSESTFSDVVEAVVKEAPPMVLPSEDQDAWNAFQEWCVSTPMGLIFLSVIGSLIFHLSLVASGRA